jgi:hypothetical protein
MERLSHDQMAFAITKLYPKLKHGKDFWVAHPVARGSSEQIGEAEIIEWPKGLEQPDRKTLRKTFNAHADEFNARMARLERDAKLARSDWTQMPDVEERKRNAWAQYRQQLRDLPQQKAFPNQIVWPEPPAG